MSNNSAHLTLLAPACFSVLTESQTPNASDSSGSPDLDLNHAQILQTNTHCFEQALLIALGQSADTPGELPIAQHRYLADTGDTAPEHCVCAELVHLQADTANARLFPSAALNLSDADANHLIDSVNELVSADGLKLSRQANGNLYFTGMGASQLDTWPAHALASGKVADYLPRQAEAGDWRRLFTEVQMLFHSHPVNEARIAKQLLPVNAIWFWGGHKMSAYSPLIDTRVFASDEFSCGVASALNIDCTSTEAANQDWQDTQGHVVVVELSVYKAWLSGDQVALRKAKQVLHEQWIEPAQQAVAKGHFKEFVLDGCEGQAIVETAKQPTSAASSSINSVKRLISKVLGRSSSASDGTSE